jgi:hypothetical protein
MENQDSIDEFLNELAAKKGIEIEEPLQQPDKYSVGVGFSLVGDRYHLHCFISDQVTVKDLPGRLSSRGKTFKETTLKDVCEKIEKSLDAYEICYHSNVPRGFIVPGHTCVSYELVPRQSDHHSNLLLSNVIRIIDYLHSQHRFRP